LYIGADLYPSNNEIEKIDVQSIPYPDGHIDIVIANHILEHVEDDLAALREINSVLVVGGYAILKTPFSRILTKTFVDSGIDTDKERYQAYGQEDHVRLYGNNIFEQIASVGFKSLVVTHNEILSDINGKKYGVNKREPLFLFEKI
jgi:ubiquinone/menaquinone biosynthesis C-methylase UbiE